MASVAVPSLAHDSQMSSRARVVSAIQRQGAFIALAALIIFGVVRYGPSFYSVYNIFDAFLNNNTYYALIALGMTFVIITGGIDLSVGSVAVLAAVAAARLERLWAGSSPGGRGADRSGCRVDQRRADRPLRLAAVRGHAGDAAGGARRGADPLRERAGDGRFRAGLHAVGHDARRAGAVAGADHRGALPARRPAAQSHAIRPACAGYRRQRGRRRGWPASRSGARWSPSTA